jgi:mannose-1-phosphate guanylyltransferase/phosphomannomutase
MGSVGENIPKALVPLARKPILEHQLDLAQRYGFEEIILLTGHLGELIESHFAQAGYRGMKLRYCREEAPLGTAGALKAIEDHLREEFVVFYGDTIMGIDLDRLARFHVRNQAAATLVVHPNHHPYDSDLLDIDEAGRVVALYPKPRDPAAVHRNLANAGLYVLSRRVLRHAPAAAKADLDRYVLPAAFRAGDAIMAYNTTEYITDMGTPERLRTVEADVLSGKVARLNRGNPRPAVFLDRDGVLNADHERGVTAENMRLLPGVAEAVRRINRSEHLAVVVTNQPAIAKGFMAEADLAAAHAKLETLLGAEHALLDRIYYCPHHPEKGFEGERPELKIACSCRKPLPGMLLTAAAELNIDLPRSVMIGDRAVDIEAGAMAGCKTILVRAAPAGENRLQSGDHASMAPADFTCGDLAEAVALVLDGGPQ